MTYLLALPLASALVVAGGGLSSLGAPVSRYVFFFQAEDGIRDLTVTGVQTCALPILPGFTTHAPDGTMWLSDAARPVLWRVTKDGKVDSVKSDRSTQGIAFGPDGALWTTSANSTTITRFAVDGTKTGSWDVPDVVMQQPMTSSSQPAPRGPVPVLIVAGPDGALWFTEPTRSRVGRIDTKGEIAMYRSP